MFLVEKANLSSPFRSTTKKPPHIIPKSYHLAARLFDEKVICHLKTLDLTQNSSNLSYISLSWLSAGVSVLSKLHTEAEDQISNMKPESDDYGFQPLYMDYSLKVLDLCNLISSAIHQLTERRLLMNFALRLLNFTDQTPSLDKLNKAKDALSRSVNNTRESTSTSTFTKEKGLLPRAKVLIEELSLLIGKLPRGTHGKTSTGKNLIRRTFYALGTFTLFIGTVLVAVLFRESETVNLQVPSESTESMADEFVWFDSFNGVQSKVFDCIKLKEKDKKKNVILEVDEVVNKAAAVCDLIEGVVNNGGGEDDGENVRACLLAGVKELESAVKIFSDGVDGLTNGVNGLFGAVLKTRNGCLEAF